jgi:hypothetical protein
MRHGELRESFVEPLIKGYIIQNTGRFMLQDPVLSERIPGTIIEQIEHNATAFKPHEWRPREEGMALWKVIAETHDPGDDEGAYQTLVRTGEAVGGYATGTFLKLLLKVLTPRMFARKFPDMFARDHKFGRIEIDTVEDHGMVVIFKEVGGYDYFAPFAHGWGGFALKSIGVKNLKMRLTPWSLAAPGPAEIRCDASWD